MSKKKYGEVKETMIVKPITIEPSKVERVGNIHDNFSEFARDAIEIHLAKYEQSQGKDRNV